MMLPKTVVIFFISLLFFFNASAYDTLKVTAVLDTALKQVSGVVEYQFPENLKLPIFEFQLYANVYSSADTPYLNGKSGLRGRLTNSKKWGSVTIDSILVDGENYGDNYYVEYTKGILSLEKYDFNRLPKIKLYFKTILPESGDRLSYFGSNYLLDGWFPTPAILKNNAEWYHPYYADNSEPFSDYFIYDVIFSAPSNIKVVGPGSSLVESKKSETNEKSDELTQYSFLFGPALDFALALDPDYLIDVSLIGTDTIRIYYRDYEYSIIPKIKKAVKKSIIYMTENIGEYAYNSLNIVFSDIGFSGGIEFPAIISLSSPRGSPAISNAYDMLTIHEVVHQWFYAMVGSDQVEHPWLDESITNFFTLKILEQYWGDTANLFDLAGFKVTMRDMSRLNATVYLGDASINQPSYSYLGGDSYFSTVYDRGALAVETIDNLLGDSLSQIFWNTYFDKYKFAHPTPEDFRQTIIETSGDSLASIYDILIESPITIDYSVSNLSNRHLDSTEAEISFILHQEGGVDYPTDYRLYLSNGDSLDYQWFSQFETEEIIHQSPYPAVSILINPDNKWAIDANLLNNSAVVSPDNRPGFRLSAGIMFLVESLLSFVGGI